MLNTISDPLIQLSDPRNLESIWELGRSPINIQKLALQLAEYPNQPDAIYILNGFSNGFSLHYEGPRLPINSTNLLSARVHRDVLHEKLTSLKHRGLLIGPFNSPPISNLRINPVGLVPKSSGGWRLITNLSFPSGASVNDFIKPAFSSVKYAKFDSAIDKVRTLGKGAFMAKADIASAFDLCPVQPSDFDLLGIKTDMGYWIQKSLPMGVSSACFIFEKVSTFLHWLVAT